MSEKDLTDLFQTTIQEFQEKVPEWNPDPPPEPEPTPSSDASFLDTPLEPSQPLPFEETQPPTPPPLDDTVLLPDLELNLHIDGFLKPYQQEKLLSEIQHLGIASEQLTLQFQSGHILLPRINEFYLVKIIQALKDADVSWNVNPTEEWVPPTVPQPIIQTSLDEHIALKLPLFMRSQPCVGFVSAEILTASCVIGSSDLESGKDLHYDLAIQKLTKEIRFKAFALGADAVIELAFELQKLSFVSTYRVTATAMTAFKKESII